MLRVTPDAMLPKPPLPDAGFLFPLFAKAHAPSLPHPGGELRFQNLPSHRKVIIIRREGPDRMKVIRQHDKRIALKGPVALDADISRAEGVYFADQQIGSAVIKRNGEEVRRAPNPRPAIIWHELK